MARLKFLLFALVVLALWLVHLFLLSPALSARALEQASLRSQAAPVALRSRLDERRLELGRVALKAASSPALQAALSSAPRGKPPEKEKLAEVRGAVRPLTPEALHRSLVLGLVTESGALFGRGDEEPLATGGGLDAEALTKAGAEGVAHEAFGQVQQFVSFQVASQARPDAEVKVAGTVVIGLPLLVDGLAAEVVKETGLGAMALLKDGKVVQVAGPESSVVEQVIRQMKPKDAFAVVKGQTSALGPLKLPVLTGSGDWMGGGAALHVVSRQRLEGTPFEAVGIASVKPFMAALADYQGMAIFGFAGLLGLTVLWTLLMGSGKAQTAEEDEVEKKAPPRAPGPPLVSPAQVAPPAAPAATPAVQAPPPSPLGLQVAPIPEASPDDFHFGPPPSALAPELPPEPNTQSGAPPTESEELPPAPPAEPPPSFDEQTRAYPVMGAPGTAESPVDFPPAPEPGEYNPEATRVAPVPDELLRESARSAAAEPWGWSPPPSAPVPPAVAAPPIDPDEAHFHEVFQDFASTRERCGEPADGLTYEKFAMKLRKNRDQLTQKYSCRTVRFQVYVKDGKAALKATPVKD